MKIKDMREMRPDELQLTLGELQQNLFTLRCQAVTEKVQNTRAIRNTRRDIARIKTVIRQRPSGTG
jgi:large subunit ribosomal protein L29